jgi:hypothetical protein
MTTKIGLLFGRKLGLDSDFGWIPTSVGFRLRLDSDITLTPFPDRKSLRAHPWVARQSASCRLTLSIWEGCQCDVCICGVLEFWNFGILEFWNFGIFYYGDRGVLLLNDK